MAHNYSSVEGLFKILKVLYTPYHYFAIHFDEKVTQITYQGFVTLFKLHFGYPTNVQISQDRINVKWGEFSILEAELLLLDMAFKWNKERPADEKWERLLILCGHSFPLQTIQSIEFAFYAMNKNMNILWDLEGPKKTCEYGQRYGEYCKRTSARCANPECTKMTHSYKDFVIYKGSQWVSLTFEYVNYIYGEGAEDFHGLINFFQKSIFAPEELLFQTSIMNSRFNTTAVTGEVGNESAGSSVPYMFKTWTDCNSYPNPRPGASPCTLGKNDLSSISKMYKDGYLFARKFNPLDELHTKIEGNLVQRIVNSHSAKQENAQMVQEILQ
ncbi:hypothetical protein O9G_002288 [Rozella allomycis CSF55]|uniref:protein xylosyltransferase n=1 Tax=Rozella allomycis (strain CSF55) TaxID=988480 RepID=A0A075AUX0_ROZAC|nr:hypothetical protein O9G_002288 [Rozella allomycis CSF55]|eukprot:EPZ32512.1 hypothetical protein O9G_002288 [Rozella allomycis CSF55]